MIRLNSDSSIRIRSNLLDLPTGMAMIGSDLEIDRLDSAAIARDPQPDILKTTPLL